MMEEPSVRPVQRGFRPDDTEEVLTLARRTLGAYLPRDLLLDVHQGWPGGFIVAEGDGRILGALAGIAPTSEKARILILAVREECQGQGIGTALMETFTRRCRRRRLRMIELEVRKGNRRTIRFYERLGFRAQERLPRHFEGEDGIRMERDLERDAPLGGWTVGLPGKHFRRKDSG